MTDTTKTQTLFLAFNERGELTGDMDRDTAIDRLRDEYVGDHIRVIEMTVTLPEIVDIKAAFSVPAEKVETVTVETT